MLAILEIVYPSIDNTAALVSESMDIQFDQRPKEWGRR